MPSAKVGLWFFWFCFVSGGRKWLFALIKMEKMAWIRRIARTLLKCSAISAMLFWYISPAAAKVTTSSAPRADVPAYIKTIWTVGGIFPQTVNYFHMDWTRQGRKGQRLQIATADEGFVPQLPAPWRPTAKLQRQKWIDLLKITGIVQVTSWPFFSWSSDSVNPQNYS